MKTKPFRALLLLAGAATLLAGIPAAGPAQAQTPYIGTIRYFAFNFAPRGWNFCNGQLIAISTNQALFSLLGTAYGGDGRSNFGLPDMRGRLPVHKGTGPGLSRRSMGQRGGVEQVTLNANQIGHRHTLRGTTNAGDQSVPTGHTLAQDGTEKNYLNAAPDVAMRAGSIGTAALGGGRHNNMPPYLAVYCNIAMVGLYPPRN